MTKCAKCGKEIYMPFICNYCGDALCSDHRLPENHNCKNIHAAISPRRARREPRRPQIQEPTTEYAPLEDDWEPTPGAEVRTYYEPDGTLIIEERVPIYNIQKPENPIWNFSALELKHLAIGILLMFSVGISMFVSIYLFSGGDINWAMVFYSACFATLAFLLHELGHKFVGIRLGNWSEFRLIKLFAILTAFSIIPIPFFKIVCPGAVQVTGDTSRVNMGKIGLAGPVVNLIQAAIFLTLANLLFVPGEIFYQVLMVATFLNTFLGVFNLIPLGPLDGLKVIRWNKALYFITIAILIGVLIYVMPQVTL